MDLKRKLTKLWGKIPSKIIYQGCRYSLWGVVLLGLVSFAFLVSLLVIICHHPENSNVRAQRAIAFVPLSVFVFFIWWIVWSFREKMDVLPRTADRGPVDDFGVKEIASGGNSEPKISITTPAGVVRKPDPCLCKCGGHSTPSQFKRSINVTSSTSMHSKMSANSSGLSYNSYGLAAATISSNQSDTKPNVPEIAPLRLLAIRDPRSGGFERLVSDISPGKYRKV
ncbi:hypothetical protein BDD12DRAFT_889682 [Trichophaea hybrida]|nr:hypothetical protein BDD12DRAFT_889682 [Trichophaea hybrida]